MGGPVKKKGRPGNPAKGRGGGGEGGGAERKNEGSWWLPGVTSMFFQTLWKDDVELEAWGDGRWMC